MVRGCPATCAAGTGPGTGLECVCPPGCSGDDDWYQWPDSCHVNEALRGRIQRASLGLSLVLLVVSLCALWLVSSIRESPWDRMKRAWRLYVMRRQEERASRIRENNEEEGGALVDAADTEKGTAEKSKKTREGRALRLGLRQQGVLSFWLIVCIFSFAVSAFVYEAILIFGDAYRWQSATPKANMLDLSVAISSTFMFLALWVAALKYYQTLPNIRQYGRLFGINSLLVRHPKLYVQWCYLCATLTAATVMGCMFFFPLAEPSRQKSFDKFGLLALATSLWVWLVSLTFLVVLLVRVFKEAEKSMSQEAKPTQLRKERRESVETSNSPKTETTRRTDGGTPISERKNGMLVQFRRLRRTLLQALFLAYVFVAFGSITLLLCAFFELFQRNMYIVFSVVALTSGLGLLLVLYFAIFRPLLPTVISSLRNK